MSNGLKPPIRREPSTKNVTIASQANKIKYIINKMFDFSAGKLMLKLKCLSENYFWWPQKKFVSL